ncbi:MAG: hypothetical protein FWC41_12985 [Firmicutes bacterium]|nr:hypothetical protein [Bacillota bacterium]
METLELKTTKNIVCSNGFPAVPSMSFEEFKKLSLKEKAMFIKENTPDGPEIPIETIAKWCKEARNEKFGYIKQSKKVAFRG